MPTVDDAFPRKSFDPGDLQAFSRGEPVLVTIADVVAQTAQSDEPGRAKIIWWLRVEELAKPIKLNATSANEIADLLLCRDFDGWVGSQVAAKAVQVPVHGTLRWVVHFESAVGLKPALPPNTDLAGYAEWTELRKAALARRLLGPAAARPASAPAAAIGPDLAARIVVSLRVRGLAWDDLVAYCRKADRADLIAGLEPRECPAGLADIARAYCAVSPVRQELPAGEFDRQVAELVASWKVPGEGGEAVDVVTGEVVDAKNVGF